MEVNNEQILEIVDSSYKQGFEDALDVLQITEEGKKEILKTMYQAVKKTRNDYLKGFAK